MILFTTELGSPHSRICWLEGEQELAAQGKPLELQILRQAALLRARCPVHPSHHHSPQLRELGLSKNCKEGRLPGVFSSAGGHELFFLFAEMLGMWKYIVSHFPHPTEGDEWEVSKTQHRRAFRGLSNMHFWDRALLPDS